MFKWKATRLGGRKDKKGKDNNKSAARDEFIFAAETNNNKNR